jgi:hypothetical protein
MRTVPAQVAQRLGNETVDLDPEQVQMRNGAQDFEIALGLGIEIQVQQNVDIRTRAFAQGLQVHHKIAHHIALHI